VRGPDDGAGPFVAYHNRANDMIAIGWADGLSVPLQLRREDAVAVRDLITRWLAAPGPSQYERDCAAAGLPVVPE